jgi:hypothetical protein
MVGPVVRSDYSSSDVPVYYGTISAYSSPQDNMGWSFNFVLNNVSASYVDVGAVPEPATWAMMIGGFGMVGGAMRRRRVSTKVSFA